MQLTLLLSRFGVITPNAELMNNLAKGANAQKLGMAL